MDDQSDGWKAAPQLTGASVLSVYLLKRLFHKDRLARMLSQRMSEPFHLNLISLFVALFGRFRTKVAFDLILRQQYAFPMLHAADVAQASGLKKITVIEFGVAEGAGLINLCKIALSVTKATGIAFDIYGFDTGRGMPPPIDYRDHPEHFQEGDFIMSDHLRLKAALPPFAHLVLGNIAATIPPFIANLSAEAPLAFVSMDVDYYSSAKQALAIFEGEAAKYLPCVSLYLDDITYETANPWCGELLAVNEFNSAHQWRKIAPFTMLRARRMLKNVQWIDQIYSVHILDHAGRDAVTRKVGPRYVIKNDYL